MTDKSTMVGMRYLLVSGIFLATAAVCWTIQRATDVKLRTREQARQEAAARLAVLAAENHALSNSVAQSNSAAALTGEELRELDRLRREVGLLRQTIREIDRLRETTSQYLADLSQPSDAGEVLPGDPQNCQSYWARDQFGYAGFAEPESALKTMLWIWVDADLESLLPHCSPEERIQLEEVWKGQSQTEMAALRQRFAAMYGLDRGGVRLLGKKQTSPEEALLDLYFEGDGKRRRFSLQKSGEQWMVTGLVAIYN
jgi:hypothetical protein